MEANRNGQNEDQSAREILDLLTGRESGQEREEPLQGQPAQEEQFVSKTRFDELLDRVRRAEERSETLMRDALSGRQNHEQGPTWDPDVEEQVAPILEHRFQKFMGERYLEENLPGFGDLKDEIKRRFEALPPEQREMYDNAVGAEALYGRIMAEKAAAMQRRRPPAMSSRAHSASGSGSTSGREAPDPHALSSQAFNSLLEDIKSRD